MLAGSRTHVNADVADVTDEADEYFSTKYQLSIRFMGEGWLKCQSLVLYTLDIEPVDIK